MKERHDLFEQGKFSHLYMDLIESRIDEHNTQQTTMEKQYGSLWPVVLELIDDRYVTRAEIMSGQITIEVNSNGDVLLCNKGEAYPDRIPGYVKM